MRTLESAITALEIAKVVTAEVPVPGLSTALESALCIAKNVQAIKDTRDDCRVLGERTAEFTLAVYQQLKGSRSHTGTKEHVTTLLHDLHSIENLVARRLRAGKRERLLFALNRGGIAKEVKVLTTKLEDSYRKFMIQAALETDQRMDTLTSGNIRMMQHIDDSAHVGEIVLGEARGIRSGLTHLAQRVDMGATFDGSFRLFARENLDFLEPLVVRGELLPPADILEKGEGTVFLATAAQHTNRVPRYRAVVKAAGELSGTVVVVHTYPNREDLKFVKDIKAAKQTCHPYVLSVLGYSRPGDLAEASYIVTEDYRPFADYLGSFRGVDRLRVYLRMIAELSVATDYLETMGARRLLSLERYWDSSARYLFGISELVYDPRYGGRIKWARDPLTLEQARGFDRTGVPGILTERERLLKVLRQSADASAEVVARCWFAFLFNTVAVDINVSGNTWSRYWQEAAGYELFPLGAWLGRTHRHGAWSILSTSDAGVKAISTYQPVPLVVPWQGSPADALAAVSQWPDGDDEDFLGKKLWLARPLEILEVDRDEMCVDVTLCKGGKRWTRYQFSCIPPDAVLLFREQVLIDDSVENAARVVRSAPQHPRLARHGNVAIARNHIYYTETAVTIAAGAARRAPPPLWFFVLKHDGAERGAAPSRRTPCGFWSAKKNPTRVPPGVVYHRTPQYEHITGTCVVPLSTWTQTIGDFVFTTQTKMRTQCLVLGEDELEALSSLREDRFSFSPRDSFFGDPDDGTLKSPPTQRV